MARVFIDGFEAGDLKLWDTFHESVGVAAPVAGHGMSGNYCLTVSSGVYYYAYTQKRLAASKSELYFAFTFRCSGGGRSPIIHFYDSAGTVILGIYRIAAAEGNFLRAHLGSLYQAAIITGIIPVTANNTYRIEVRIKPLNSGGIVQTKVNGILDIDYSGDTTNGLENVQGFGLLNNPGDAFSWESPYYIDDFVVDDAAWPGNTKIQGIKPTGPGASSHSAWAADTVIGLNEFRKPTVFNGYEYECTARADDFKTGAVEPVWGIVVGAPTDDDTNITWTCRVGAWNPSTGDNYACVDEVPASETDYVSLNNIGNVDLYAAGDLVGTIGSVKCVQVQALVKAEGEPTPTHLQLVMRSGATDYFSADKAVANTASAQRSNIWETDPATAVAWTESGVNAMQIGVKAVA